VAAKRFFAKTKQHDITWQLLGDFMFKKITILPGGY
jgi:hypothetical protein